VGREKNLQKLIVADHVRVVIHLDRFDVVADPLIGRIARCAPRVSDPRPDNPFQTPEPGVATPESAKGESGGLKFLAESGRACVHIGYTSFGNFSALA